MGGGWPIGLRLWWTRCCRGWSGPQTRRNRPKQDPSMEKTQVMKTSGHGLSAESLFAAAVGFKLHIADAPCSSLRESEWAESTRNGLLDGDTTRGQRHCTRRLPGRGHLQSRPRSQLRGVHAVVRARDGARAATGSNREGSPAGESPAEWLPETDGCRRCRAVCHPERLRTGRRRIAGEPGRAG